jgi:alpha/beta superfamily hydrolase
VLVIVGGPQYRAGSHRQFTLLARSLAEQGFAVLRFDYRGMGDSTGAMRDQQSTMTCARQSTSSCHVPASEK